MMSEQSNLDKAVRDALAQQTRDEMAVSQRTRRTIAEKQAADPQVIHVCELSRQWLKIKRGFDGECRVEFSDWIYAWTLDWNLQTPVDSIKIGGTLDEAEKWLTTELSPDVQP